MDRALHVLFETVVTSIPDVVTTFGRLSMRGQAFHSRMYKRPTSRNDYAIMYEDSRHMPGLGLVSYFCYKPECTDEVYAVVEQLFPRSDIRLANDPITQASVSHITPCQPPQATRLVVIPVLAILQKVVYIHFPDMSDYNTFVAVFPNTVESD